MDHLPVVGKTEHFGDLSEHIELHIDTQLVLVLRQEMIEPDGLGIMLEDQRRAKHMLGETFAPHNRRMLERFEKLGFTLRCPLDGSTLLSRRSGAHRVHTHAAFDIGEPGMRGLPVLIPGTCVKQVV